MYDVMSGYRTRIDINDELNDIYNEGEALESEYFMLSINMSDFGAPYGIALEDSSSSGAGVKLKNMAIKMVNFIKRLIAAIPKMFAKLFQMIKHSKLVTKARLQAGTPKDLRHIAKDKAQVIKQRRLEILTLKQKLLELGDKKISKACYLSEEINQEINAILRYTQVSKSTRAEVINGKFDVSIGKVQKLQHNYDELKGINTNDVRIHLEKKIESLKETCGSERLFALCVPTYNGNDRSEEYKNKIERECNEIKNVVDQLDFLITKNKSFAEAWHGGVANVLGAIEDRTRKKEYERDAKGNIVEKNDDEFRLSNIPRKKEAIMNLDRSAKVMTSGIMKIINLYKQCSTDLTRIAQEYCTICALVYKVYNVPNEGDSSENLEEPENESKKTVKNYPGTVRWNDKSGLWEYVRMCIDVNGNTKEFKVELSKEKDKDTKPNPSKETVDLCNKQIKKSKNFKQFVEEEESNLH